MDLKKKKLNDIIPTQNFLLVGDCNAHNTLWSNRRDIKGEKLLEVLLEKNLVILNTGTNTMADHHSTPDSSISTPTLGGKAEWSTLNNPCGSDHLPILIKLNIPHNTTGAINTSKWILKKADWCQFQKLCSESLLIDENKIMDTISETFTNTLQNICEKTIPKTQSKTRKIKPPGGTKTAQQSSKRENKSGKNISSTEHSISKAYTTLLKSKLGTH